MPRSSFAWAEEEPQPCSKLVASPAGSSWAHRGLDYSIATCERATREISGLQPPTCPPWNSLAGKANAHTLSGKHDTNFAVTHVGRVAREDVS